MLSSTGHLLINLRPDLIDSFTFVSGTQENELSAKNFYKLHVQFGHCTANRLVSLLKSSRYWTGKSKDVIHEIIDNCEVCRVYRRPSFKPVVGLPHSYRFNECVAMDLHQVTELGKNSWYLHIIDLFSKFSVATLIDNKMSSTIVNEFIVIWVSVFGIPNAVLTDNGGEFSNEEFRSMAECFNIRIKTTAAESPWINGTCERHNATLTETFLKTMEGARCEPRIALAEAVMAKNCLLNHDGFSPYQIVFGANPCLPGVMTDALPALENVTVSKYVADHLSALHVARKSFVESENSLRIKRALKSNIRADEGPFASQDFVYYKRDDNRWKGPATVIGQDGRLVFIRHGGQVLRIHPCKLRKTNPEFITSVGTLSTENIQNEQQKGYISEDSEYEMNLENEQVECAERLRSTSEASEQGTLGTISEA